MRDHLATLERLEVPYQDKLAQRPLKGSLANSVYYFAKQCLVNNNLFQTRPATRKCSLEGRRFVFISRPAHWAEGS